ncbi:capsid cement protein [Nocardioides jensenii]|uniref:capsid cement protein n=1 Tax=Nocardioides jensenii TaxID=1843 RepID=UPI0008316E20|nr:capsid cement protein [Nocardioides jensenii]
MADYLPLYKPGQAITSQASADIAGGQAVQVSGSGTVAPATAATQLIVGVAAFDAKSGEKVTFFGRGTVHRLLATGTVTAAQVVEAAAAGSVATHTQGTNDVRVFGVALTTATDASVEIMEV